MPTVSLTGNDNIIINGSQIKSNADGTIAELTFPNEIANFKVGASDGAHGNNAIYAFNATGVQCELKIRLVRGGPDDAILQALLKLQQDDFASFILLTGSLVKRFGAGDGTVGSDTYNLTGGIFTKQVEAKSNVEGDTEQSVAIYMMKFRNTRAISAPTAP